MLRIYGVPMVDGLELCLVDLLLSSLGLTYEFIYELLFVVFYVDLGGLAVLRQVIGVDTDCMRRLFGLFVRDWRESSLLEDFFERADTLVPWWLLSVGLLDDPRDNTFEYF